jgi:hypothetical protein
MTEPANRRRFQFGLRSLFWLVAFVAIACWLYWDGWPRYRMYREQVQFEATVREKFSPGHTFYFANDFVGGMAHNVVGGFGDADGNSVAYVRREWPNLSFVIYGRLKPGAGLLQHQVEFQDIKVFRLSGVPNGYRPQTERGKREVADKPKGNAVETGPSLAYKLDFLEMISGRHHGKLNIEYELIHSVPPEVDGSSHQVKPDGE